MTDPTPPTRTSTAIFLAKSGLLKLRRLLRDARSFLPRLKSGDKSAYPYLIAESVTPLWVEKSVTEKTLQLGKVQNLRVALRHFQSVELPAGVVFSFWKQVARATKRRGFVEGRQISEGCLIPAIGGGICQLSNALYEVALGAKLTIVERHPHTRIVPGSASEWGKDATVFWNYLDLRFVSPVPLLLTATLTDTHLIVQLHGQTSVVTSTSVPISFNTPFRQKLSVEDHSCASCGMISCFRQERKEPTHATNGAGNHGEKTAFLVDKFREEWGGYLRENRQPQDVLMIPLDGIRWSRPPYAWDCKGYAQIETATLTTLKRAYTSRKLAEQGATRQTALLKGAESLAKAYARKLMFDLTHLCIDQNLLPFLWKEGHLGGRRYTVLMTRLSLDELQRTLDTASRLHPESVTLKDFRAPQWLLEAERNALAGAAQIVTTHPLIAALFPHKSLLLSHALPRASTALPGVHVLFPCSTLGRKGAYEMREAARDLNLEVTLGGKEFEGDQFWDGVKTRRANSPLPGQSVWNGAAVVVQPSWVEENPGRLLSAIAAGVPVICTPACGVGGLPGVLEVEAGSVEALKAALTSILSATPAPVAHPLLCLPV